MISRKRAVLPLVAIIALAMVPTAAQALEGVGGNGSQVHWQLNSKRTAAGVAIPVIEWGTAKLETAIGTVTCKNAAAGRNENTAATGSGEATMPGKAHSAILMFASYECKETGGECVAPREERVTAFNLTGDASPNTGVWPSTVVEEGVVNAEEKFRSYDQSGAGAGENPIKLNTECVLDGERIGSLLFQSGPVLTETGSSTPLVINGTSAAKPSETSFEDPLKETGHLYAPDEVELVKETTGELVSTKEGSNKIADVGKSWAPVVKAGCRIYSEAIFPNAFVSTLNSTNELTFANTYNPTKAFAVKTGNFEAEFRCGARTTVPQQATTRGKFKFVGYLDDATTPLVTIGSSVAP